MYSHEFIVQSSIFDCKDMKGENAFLRLKFMALAKNIVTINRRRIYFRNSFEH